MASSSSALEMFASAQMGARLPLAALGAPGPAQAAGLGPALYQSFDASQTTGLENIYRKDEIKVIQDFAVPTGYFRVEQILTKNG